MSERAIPSIHGADHIPGGPDPIPGGLAPYQIEVYEPDRIVLVGDESFEWEVPEDLDGSTLVKVDAYLTTPSSSGTVQVQLAKLPDGFTAGEVDLLTTKISIPVGEVNAKEGTPAVISTAAGVADFVWGDHIRVDVDNTGTGAKGLGLIAYFTPTANAQIVIEGAKGDPGGVNAWTGQWSGAGSYNIADAVSNNGSSYVAIVNNPTLEPGVDTGWQAEWMLLTAAQKTSSVDVVLDGNGYVLDTGVKTYVRVPYACALTEVEMLADLSGSMVVDIWKDTYTNFPPTNADSITSSSPPTLASAVKSLDTVLSGWTTSLAADDILAFNVDSCSTITRVTISLKFEKV